MQSGSTPQTPDYFSGVQTPDINDMEVQLQQLVQQGVLTPEDAQAVTLGSSDMNNISTDPSLKSSQMDALLGLQDIANNKGLTANDKAQLADIQNQENTAAKGQRDAIIQSAEARGMGGSGLDLMAQLQNEQDSATRASQRDLGVAGQAQQRALEALMQQGTMAGQMQNQQFNQVAQVASANDAISKFNAQNQQNTINQNVAAHNAAQAQNLSNKQSIANANAATQNAQEQYNKSLVQQNFNNQMAKAGGQSGVASTNAANAGKDSQNQANTNNQFLGTLIGAGATMYGKKDGGLIGGEPSDGDSVFQFTQPGEMVIKKDQVPEVLKKQHTDKNGEVDIAGLLDQITGYKYGYSNKGKHHAS